MEEKIIIVNNKFDTPNNKLGPIQLKIFNHRVTTTLFICICDMERALLTLISHLHYLQGGQTNKGKLKFHKHLKCQQLCFFTDGGILFSPSEEPKVMATLFDNN